ncbi:hypothetical protein BG55_14570 [Erwinia mallotivora]|uniref:Uncharacterized protein n=1 Tax=Erwinia mallotivora TaxID=69222 RepID=A0A014PVZ2_9GAMM|nr:hypothetical protein BG55_14570 [Erwinia mallotivora]
MINNESHWSMTKSALEQRLSRPDKIYKTLMDALVLAGKSKERLKLLSFTIKNNAMHIGSIKKTLRGLYLDRKSESRKSGLIGGLETAKAENIRGGLDAISHTFLEPGYLSPDEIEAARNSYLDTVLVILQDILSKSESEKRGQLTYNADVVISDIMNFRKWIEGYEKRAVIPWN